jgi:hypothetical protein
MSTILVDNLTGKTSAGDITVTSEGGAATQSLQQGLAKEWINFDGTGTISIRDSANVSSIVDRGTASYTVNASNAFGNASYATTAMAKETGNGDVLSVQGTPTTTEIQFANFRTDSSNPDQPYCMLTMMGDLA